MKKNKDAVYYGDYLQLDKLLDAQHLQSEHYGPPAHDETLFIIVHQAYELWFKQVLHELRSVLSIFRADHIADESLMTVVHRLNRIGKIQQLLNQQIGVMETMTPQDFLEFRDYLVPASGFQSIQFKEIEISLGLKRDSRIKFDQQSFYNRINDADRAYLTGLEQQPGLFECVDDWLARMPFLRLDNFAFADHFKQTIEDNLAKDEAILRNNDLLSADELQAELTELEGTRENFAALFDQTLYQKMQDEGRVRLSQRALQGALFINLYREEPVFNLPFQVLNCLADMDDNMTIWRYRHAMMVQRMLGSKIGTGGSSGHDYLRKTTERNRIFTDLLNLATYLLPKSALPPLPDEVKHALRRG
ncbi:tryptophan 2,3-dioxygenase [Aliidiomarina sedimenti]|uniref:Tryptophan 2,3-dioxygenase n=1 Tax=Aliidiomarina sedimenti TaxID=1933879 RepID=A0ABY0BXR3_9GAMM|nr:tryptophan 2,3-dioxygenase family protein [Aliidiomarina sedimenti]RUO28951.1 tryptophan 2,3-dioxygenase [Aliidiomarina sedimenti]